MSQETIERLKEEVISEIKTKLSDDSLSNDSLSLFNEFNSYIGRNNSSVISSNSLTFDTDKKIVSFFSANEQQQQQQSQLSLERSDASQDSRFEIDFDKISDLKSAGSSKKVFTFKIDEYEYIGTFQYTHNEELIKSELTGFLINLFLCKCGGDGSQSIGRIYDFGFIYDISGNSGISVLLDYFQFKNFIKVEL